MTWETGGHPETEIIGASLFLARSLGERPLKNSQMFITKQKKSSKNARDGDPGTLKPAAWAGAAATEGGVRGFPGF